jgi:peptidoglycan/LPS O-acetylase OafA/YrhL
MATGKRGDIQGLRAVAVLTVVAAHAGVPFLAGGFVGVDVFFVISGFLISRLLFREVAAAGRVSLTSFWTRRARRILPAATLVTVVTVVVSLLWTSLIDARQVVEDAVWSTLFAANVHFAEQDTSYFSSGTSPLQHYWSLAVEEQFYVVWPVLLLACVGVTRLVRGPRPGQPRLPRRAVLWMLLAVTGGSFAWSLWLGATQPGSAYFSTPMRAWELGAGALTALVAAPVTRLLTRRALTLLAASGLAMVGLSCLLLDPGTSLPGYAVPPVLGSVLVLLAGSGRHVPATAVLLDNAPMRVLGDWSYSIYLWHWPALVLGERVLARELRGWETALVVAAVLVVSGLTFRFVETPFRTGRPAPGARLPRSLVLYPASVTLVAATCLVGWHWTEVRGGERGDNPAITVAATAAGPVALTPDDAAVALVEASVAAARAGVAVPSDLTPDLLQLRESVADVGECAYADDVRMLCPRGSGAAGRTLVVIGDSHARAWIPAFDRIIADTGWRAFYLVKPQCGAAHVLVAPVHEDRPFTECRDFHDWVLSQVGDLRPDLVVVASAAPANGVYDGSERRESVPEVAALLAAGYADLFAALQQDAARVVLLRDVPTSPRDPGTCLTRGEPDLGDCLFSPVERSETLAQVAVDSALSSGAEVVDPTPWLCDDGDCPVVVGSTLTYRDTEHLTTEYAAALAGPLGDALGVTSTTRSHARALPS